jgi:CheY-like chemotaxis protein
MIITINSQGELGGMNPIIKKYYELKIKSLDGEECLEVYRRQKLQEHHHHHQQREGEHHHGKDGKTHSSSSSYFDVVILDYKMPKKDGLQVAKEILEINPDQRIIFASAYVIETLRESVKELKRVVELMQNPFQCLHW